jgi:voltage-gated potassium channel
LRPFANVRRLFHGLGHALRQPEVQGVAQLALSLILVATIFYWLVEGWSLLDAAYFAVVTIATVGYGDLAPQTTLGKIFTIGYIVSGIGIFVAAVTALAQATLHADQAPPEQSERSNRGRDAGSVGRGPPDDADTDAGMEARRDRLARERD